MTLLTLSMKMVRYLTGESAKAFKPTVTKIPRIINDSRTQWVVQQLQSGRVLEVKDIKVENPRWNCPYTPLKAARKYLKAKGTPVKSIRVGQHGEKRYFLEE